jgi:hypothetical protein
MDKVDHASPDQLASRDPRRKATVSWSAAVDTRLDQLVALATTTEPERCDLLAAIVAAAPADGDKLDRLVARWRKQTVREVVLDVPEDATVVRMPRHGPGRRPRRPAER